MPLRRSLPTCALLAVCVLCWLALPAMASAASPWWQVTTSARPTNLGSPKNEVQEVVAPATPFTLTVEGGSPHLFNLPPAFPEGTAANVQAALEADYGAGNVRVTGGPAGGAPLIVEATGADQGRWVPQITAGGAGASARVATPGGSGRLTVTAVNLGDAPLDASSVPITVSITLPPGVSAYHAEGLAGDGLKLPAPCTVQALDSVTCSFGGELSPYEGIQVEVFVSVSAGAVSGTIFGHVDVSGGNAPGAAATEPIMVSDEKTPFGIESLSMSVEQEGGAPATQAGSHPFQFTTDLQLNHGPLVSTPGEASTPGNVIEEQPGLPRNFRFRIPPGLVGNPTAIPQCSYGDFLTVVQGGVNLCPDDTVIGVAVVTIIEPKFFHYGLLKVPIFNLPPSRGEPARFGFEAVKDPVVLDTAVRGGEAYGISVTVADTSEVAQLLSSTVTLWGVPGDPRHDESRGWGCLEPGLHLGCRSSEGISHPFLRLPTSCGTLLRFSAEMEPWNVPVGSEVARASFEGVALDGCNREPFDPTIAVESDTQAAEAPSGLAVHLTVPQESGEAPNGIGESDVRRTRVALPTGLHINPAAANGLAACTEAQMGFSHMDGEEAVFDEGPASCPEASKLGRVKITTPLLEEPVTGWVYQAAQGANPFGSLLALYVVAEAPKSGILVKLAGRVDTDRQTGQVVSTFAETPQLPFSEFELTIFGGGTAPLATSTCGAYKTTTQIEPWSGGATATPSSEFQVSGCPSPQPFAPGFAAGTDNPLAGAYSPFVLNLTRKDGEGQISRIDTALPKGLTGRLAGIPYCPEASIRQAEGRSNPGEGSLEQRSPSCPPASKVGTVRVGSGVGPNPYFVDGDVYLAGPYKGGRLSLVIVTPAVAGPFDLGTVVVRTALYVDERTAEITAKSDPLPTMLQGIPLDVRSIALRMDRSNFTLNPTSCEAMALTGTATSVSGQAAALRNRFQVGSCGALKFRPRLKLQLKGATRRSGHPALKAVVTYPKKGRYANIARAQVGLPHSEFLDQGNLNKVCKQADLLAATCPKSSIYGHAKAWTPLLDKPLQGPVYLGVGFGYKLPALVADLNGQIRILLVGKVDTTKRKGIRNTFEAVPDAPVSRFILTMKGGKRYGLIENSENLCARTQRASALFDAQNGLSLHMRPKIQNGCKHRKPRKKQRAHARASAGQQAHRAQPRK